MDIKIIKHRTISQNGIGLLSIIRDEIYFLPKFFEYYRQLGVNDFLIYDDRSADGSTEFLVSQPDCTVLSGPYTYDTAFGVPFYERIPQFPYARKLPIGIRGRLGRMLVARCPQLFPGEAPPVSQLFKVPLLKRGQGVKRIGSHYVNAPSPAEDLVALAHFKFS